VSLDRADHERIAALEARVRAQDGSQYAGVYLADDGSVVFRTTGVARLDRWGISVDSLGTGRAVLIRPAERSLAELLATNDRVTASFPVLEAAGVHLTSAGVDNAANRVGVRISTNSSADAESVLAARFGDAVDVVRVDEQNVGGADRTSPYPHVRGGQRIVKRNGGSCTAGLQGRTSDGRYFIMTAGHCDYNHTTGGWWEGVANGPTIGLSHNNHWANGTDCDCMAVGPLPVGAVTQLVYITPTSSEPVDTVVTPYQNERACYSGASTATNPVHCGIAWSYPAEYVQSNYGNALMTHVWLGLRADPTYGDSGAPVYDGFRALGIHSGHSNSSDRWWFVPITMALARLGLSLVYYTPVP
jgi:hypothetical protein